MKERGHFGDQKVLMGDSLRSPNKVNAWDSHANARAFEAKTLNDKADKIKQLTEDLKKTQREQVTDIYASFPTRLGRYVKIKLIRYTLNHLTL
ncbi:MAG: hypothetical protein [Microviridae sp.]|nr:MAG: hypothetical protein [Microviridae sp.]